MSKTALKEESVELPKKWYEVYPAGTKEGDEEVRFFKALARHPKYAYRSVNALSKESGLPLKRIEEIINKYAFKMKPALIYPHPSNDRHWGYWERCMKEDDFKKEDIANIDLKHRIKKINAP